MVTKGSDRREGDISEAAWDSLFIWREEEMRSLGVDSFMLLGCGMGFLFLQRKFNGAVWWGIEKNRKRAAAARRQAGAGVMIRSGDAARGGYWPVTGGVFGAPGWKRVSDLLRRSRESARWTAFLLPMRYLRFAQEHGQQGAFDALFLRERPEGKGGKRVKEDMIWCFWPGSGKMAWESNHVERTCVEGGENLSGSVSP